MNWRRTFTLILIFLLLVSAFVAAFHHHENAADDHDCPICVVSLHQPAAGPVAAAFDGVPFLVAAIFAAISPVFTEKLLACSLSSRAPPA